MASLFASDTATWRLQSDPASALRTISDAFPSAFNRSTISGRSLRIVPRGRRRRLWVITAEVHRVAGGPQIETVVKPNSRSLAFGSFGFAAIALLGRLLMLGRVQHFPVPPEGMWVLGGFFAVVCVLHLLSMGILRSGLSRRVARALSASGATRVSVDEVSATV